MDRNWYQIWCDHRGGNLFPESVSESISELKFYKFLQVGGRFLIVFVRGALYGIATTWHKSCPTFGVTCAKNLPRGLQKLEPILAKKGVHVFTQASDSHAQAPLPANGNCLSTYSIFRRSISFSKAPPADGCGIYIWCFYFYPDLTLQQNSLLYTSEKKRNRNFFCN